MKKIFMAIASVVLACGIGVAAVGCGASFDPEGGINVYNRESGSGTRDAFLELLGISDDQLVSAGAGLASTGAVLNAVMDDPQGIGYISLGSLDDTVKAVSIDGVEPTAQNIIDEEYTVWRPFEMMYQTENYNSNDLLREFVEFLESAEAQEAITAYGYVSTNSSAAAYTVPESLTETSLTIGGSTSVQPLMSQDTEDGDPCLITVFRDLLAENDINVTITYDGTGSGTGRQNTVNGTYDIGFASAEVTDEDMAENNDATHTWNGTIYQLCADGIAIIVNTGNTVTNLTTEQLRNIYTGANTTWADFVAAE